MIAATKQKSVSGPIDSVGRRRKSNGGRPLRRRAEHERNETEPVVRESPLESGGLSFHDVTESVARPLERAPSRGWWLCFLSGLAMVALLGVAAGWLAFEGLGVTGLNRPVSSAFGAIHTLFWLGIGVGGTLLSASLLLLRPGWGSSIRRTAEAMTLCALLCASVFPVVYLGRPWLAYWMAALPNQMGIWPQFRSPQAWAFVAIGSYGVVSALLLYVGLLPDFATLRDRSRGRRRRTLAALALGWRGSIRHGHHLRSAHLLLAGSAAALALAVCAIASEDLAASRLPGWHATTFPPFLVAAAVLSGTAAGVTLAVSGRRLLHLERVIARRDLDRLAKILPIAALAVGLGHLLELFVAWFSEDARALLAFESTVFGAHAWAYWTMVALGVLGPQLLWLERVRSSLGWLFALSLLVQPGMWCERFVVVVGSLHRGLLPATWSEFQPTLWDVAILFGGLGLFVTLFCLFVRFLPIVAVAEVKSVQPQTRADRERAPLAPPGELSDSALARGESG